MTSAMRHHPSPPTALSLFAAAAEALDAEAFNTHAPDPMDAWIAARSAADAALLAAFERAAQTLAPHLAARNAGDRYESIDMLRRLGSAMKDREDIADKLWEEALTTLCDRAKTTFAHPSGAPLTIDANAVAEQFGQDHEARRARRHGDDSTAVEARPSYADLWAYLRTTYDTTDQKDAAETRVIHAFIKDYLLAFREVKPATWRGGKLVLDFSLHTEKPWRSGEQGFCLPFNGRERTVERLYTLGHVLAMLDTPSAAAAKAAARYDWGQAMRSRQRFAFGDGLSIIVYSQKFEVEIAGHVGESLMALISPAIANATLERNW